MIPLMGWMKIKKILMVAEVYIVIMMIRERKINING